MASNNAKKQYVAVHEEVVKNITSQTKQYSKKNIEKALSITGHKDLASTMKWLNNHIGDRTLNEDTQREYILFLCPTGPLLSEISKFYEQSYNKCGSNSAHNLFPHITLSSFFKINNHLLPYILDCLNDCFQSTRYSQPDHLQLILQRSEGYIGLFLNAVASTWMTELTSTFATAVHKNFGLLIKPHERKFHLTLAYNFDLSKTQELENLAKKINIDVNARWELNIYSRDPSFNGKNIHSITHEYKAVKQDELTLNYNSHIIMDPEPPKRSGWKRGTDNETGKTGLFPDNFTKKTAEWRIWTKNFSLPVFRGGSSNPGSSGDIDMSKQTKRSQSFNLKKDKKEELRNSLRNPSKSSTLQSSSSNNPPWESNTRILANSRTTATGVTDAGDSSGNAESMNQYQAYAIRDSNKTPLARTHSEDRKKNRNSTKRNERETTAQLLQYRTSNMSISGPSTTQVKRLFSMRHAERVDLTFGHDWFQIYIDDRGYHRRNLNLPRRIPTRKSGPRDFFMDCPITEVGTFQAKLAGEALRAKGVIFNAVFSSPSLRSIQTAASLLDGLMDTSTKIKIEPALFEWMAWCRNTFPKFMRIEDLVDYGLNVDPNYAPFYPLAQFNANEKTDEYYYRSHSFIQFATRNYPGNVLVVGHSATLDVTTRQLTGQPIRKTDDLIRVVQKVPYCGLCVSEEQPNNTWKLVQAPIPSLTHGQNQAFDWRDLESHPNQNGRV